MTKQVARVEWVVSAKSDGKEIKAFSGIGARTKAYKLAERCAKNRLWTTVDYRINPK